MFLQKLINGIVFLHFLLVSIQIPLHNYAVSEKLHFHVGLTWVELLLDWPLAIVSLYGIILNKRSWVKKTCLIYGVYNFTSLVAISSKWIVSGRGSLRLVTKIYGPI
ncbi:hypothetical protein MKW92_028166 [Papaver armeniacum]|nr:hypothetical protein MKW92_028166 [Papaver armeniacum]